ncbi:MAG: hypothetical protein HKL82_07680 [Acidimicrobiaceae bacterium]|nr:hypothetical protein [Acidimicrobiaceae bacterium]
MPRIVPDLFRVNWTGLSEAGRKPKPAHIEAVYALSIVANIWTDDPLALRV